MQSVTVTSYVYIEGKEEETSSSSKQNLQISLRDSPVLPPATYGQPIYYDLYLTNYGEDSYPHQLLKNNLPLKFQRETHFYRWILLV